MKGDFTRTTFKPDTRGYAALGLALMGDTTRVGQIKKYQRGKGLAMETLRQTPLALGILGGKTEVSTLVAHFNRGFKKNELYRASNAAYGLAWNRDVSAVNWLLTAYAKSGDKNVRGLSLVALGYLAARDEVSPLTRCYSNFSFRRRFDWDVLATISGIL